jgi:hypothetical protein
MLMCPVGFRSEKGKCQAKTEKYRPGFSSEGAPRQQTRNCQQQKSKKEWEKLVAGPRWVPDTKTDWPTDRLS